MRIWALLALALGMVASALPARSDNLTVANFQGGADRGGHYVVPGLTWASAPNGHLTPGFRGLMAGNIIAQPLYWHLAGAAHGLIIVATSENYVQALDPVTGNVVWARSMGPSVPGSDAACEGKKPLGVFGTPVIDDAAGSIYVDAFVLDSTGAPQHLVYGLSLANGSVLPGWPVNIAQALAARGVTLTPSLQDQRGALALAGGKLYVPYGGNGGDCDLYHGAIVGLDEATATVSGVWQSRGPKGGIWAQGGVVFDGTSLFISTGTGMPLSPMHWDDTTAVIRLRPDLLHSPDTHDLFAPKNWDALNNSDLEIGGTAPLPIDVPTATGGIAQWLLALGKNGDAYVLDRTNLGGIGRDLFTKPVATSIVITAPATYTVADAIYVVFSGSGAGCPPPAANIALTAIKITAQPGPAISTAWCGAFAGGGSPMVTTSDGVNDPIAWMMGAAAIKGAAGDGLLHGFNMMTGQPLFAGGGVHINGAQRFAPVLAAEGRLFVAGGDLLFSFSFGP